MSSDRIYGANVKIDLNACYYCKQAINDYERTVDHLIPESRGGIRANKNKVPSCGDCNRLKGDMNPEEFYRAVQAMIRLETREYKKNFAYLRKIENSLIILIWSKENKKDAIEEKEVNS